MFAGKTQKPAARKAVGEEALTPPLAHPFPMAERLAAWRAGSPLPLLLREQVHVRIRGRDVTFCLNMQRDPIQNSHRQGRFYEEAELDALLPVLPAGATVLDIGANTGNHALFLALFAGAAHVVVVEPNPLALEPLVGNVLANGLGEVIDLSHLGFGLGAENSAGWGMKRHDRNLGATRMRGGEGDLTLRRGDDVFAELTPDLVKIDVEGMEMDVLAGLEALIARTRPLILIEVSAAQQAAFESWVAARGYHAVTPGRTGPKNTNHLLFPRECAGHKNEGNHA